jgi:hypothetical protein
MDYSEKFPARSSLILVILHTPTSLSGRTENVIRKKTKSRKISGAAKATVGFALPTAKVIPKKHYSCGSWLSDEGNNSDMLIIGKTGKTS